MRPGVALVTGAGSGLGRLITVSLAAAGWRVAAAGRRQLPLEETAARTAAGSVFPVPADVGNAESVAALFEAVADRFGRLDLLDNPAGTVAPGGAVDELEPAGWDSIVATNLTGSYLCAHHAVRMQAPAAALGPGRSPRDAGTRRSLSSASADTGGYGGSSPRERAFSRGRYDGAFCHRPRLNAAGRG